jgi:hypothetical protein
VVGGSLRGFLGLIAFLLFVAAFIARAIANGLEAEDYVLWMLAGLAMMTVAHPESRSG